VSPAKTAELIEMMFGTLTPMDPRKHASGGDTYGHNLANMIE